MMDSRLKCITFDMDGCLVDTEAAYAKSWRTAFEFDGFPIEDQIINSWSGRGVTFINSEIDKLTKDHERTMKLRQLREDNFFQALEAGQVELKPYAREIIEFLKKENIKVGLVSSTYKGKGRRVLEYFRLLEKFDFTVFGDEVKNVKPSPEIYIEALKRSQEKISDILVFEDSVSGVESAKAAGFTGIIHVPDSSVKYSQVNLDTFARVKDFSQGIELIKKIINNKDRGNDEIRRVDYTLWSNS